MKKVAVLLVIFFMVISVFISFVSPTSSEARGRAAPKSTEPTRVFDAGYNAVWPAVIGTISQSGFTILNSDRASGLVSTDYRLYSQPSTFIPKPGYRFKVNVLVDQVSKYRTQVIITSIWEMGWYQSRTRQVFWSQTNRRDVQIETKIFNLIQYCLDDSAKSARLSQ